MFLDISSLVYVDHCVLYWLFFLLLRMLVNVTHHLFTFLVLIYFLYFLLLDNCYWLFDYFLPYLFSGASAPGRPPFPRQALERLPQAAQPEGRGCGERSQGTLER